MAEIEIKGLEAFKADLDRLDFGKRVPALVRGVVRAVEPLRVQIGMDAPVATGLLSRSIVAQEAKGSDLSSVTVDIGVTSKAFYGFFQEYGTAHHPAQPFFQPAIDESLDEVQDKIAQFIQDEIQSALGG